MQQHALHHLRSCLFPRRWHCSVSSRSACCVVLYMERRSKARCHSDTNTAPQSHGHKRPNRAVRLYQVQHAAHESRDQRTQASALHARIDRGRSLCRRTTRTCACPHDSQYPGRSRPTSASSPWEPSQWISQHCLPCTEWRTINQTRVRVW